MALDNLASFAFAAYNASFHSCLEGLHVDDQVDLCAVRFVCSLEGICGSVISLILELFQRLMRAWWTTAMLILAVMILFALVANLYARPARAAREYVPVDVDEVTQFCRTKHLAMDTYTPNDVFLGMRENALLVNALRFTPVDDATAARFNIPAAYVPVSMMMNFVRRPTADNSSAELLRQAINVFHREHDNILHVFYVGEATSSGGGGDASAAGFKIESRFEAGSSLFMSYTLFSFGPA